MRLDHLLSKDTSRGCITVELSREPREAETRPEGEAVTESFPVAMRLGDTPVSIPNTMVKPQTADGTMLATAWESRRLPGYGGLAQLGERLPCKQEVTRSNLVFSIRIRAYSSAG